MALYDEGDDGTIERQTIYRYDGCLLVAEEGAYADGRPGHRTARTHDVRGHLATVLHDVDGDGQVDVSERWSADVDGKPLIREVDLGDDGLSGQGDFEVRYTYHPDGRVRSQEKDIAKDGIIDARYAYVHLQGGETIIEDYVWLTSNQSGEIYYRNTHGLRNGLVYSLTHDMHANGVIQWRRSYGYDDQGRMTEEIQDTGDDDIVELRTTYSYDCWAKDEP